MFFCGDSGERKYSGFFEQDDNWYYANNKGYVATGFTKVGKQTFINEKGVQARIASSKLVIHTMQITKVTFFVVLKPSMVTNSTLMSQVNKLKVSS